MDKELEKQIERLKSIQRNDPRSHWKTDPINGMHYTVFCKFYLYNRFLGAAYIPEGSMAIHRRKAAQSLGITYYNGLVFNNRDMRSVRVKCKNGKIRRDIDFIPKEDFPGSMDLRRKKISRKKFLQQYPIDIKEAFKNENV